MKNKKRIPSIGIAAIIVGCISIILLAISIITSVISVKRTEDAISNIGSVTYTVEIEEKIDKAVEYYNKLDKNIGLDDRVSNKKDLDAAIYNYVRLGIKKAIYSYNRRFADNIAEEDIKLYVNQAYDSLVKYFEESEYEGIEGYSDFVPLLEIYQEKKENTNTDSNTSNNDAEEPEIC